MFSDLDFRVKIAAVFFALAKLMSIPTAYLVINNDKHALQFIIIYSFVLMTSIIFAASARKSSSLESEVKYLINKGKSFKVEDGKIIEVSQK
jgi:uncharacterized membrane protein YcaP (DUF421 family)